MTKSRPPTRPASPTPRRRAPLIVSQEAEDDPDRVAPRMDELDSVEQNEVYEQAKRANYEIPRLQQVSMPELQQLADEVGVENAVGLGRPELIFEILKKKVTSRGLGWGEGTLDILPEGFGFLRSRRYNYTAGPDDIYISPSQIRRLNLKQGHEIAGPVRPPKEGEKYFALLHVEAVDGRPVEDLKRRIPFDDLTPIVPTERLVLDSQALDDGGLDVRLVDLLAPMGFGQRVLILSPPNSRRNTLLASLAQAILAGNPDAYLIQLLLDERPEEVTVAVRSTGPDDRREVVASTFDEPASRHIALAELAAMKARRLVESGRHVVLLVDSLTSLVRAYHQEVPHTGKILAAGLDSAALQEPKRLFGAARNVEEGGSLTIIATALTGTGSRVDEVVAEEFRGKGNCEIVLDEHLAGLHIYPAIDVLHTGTRREEALLSTEDLERLQRLRKAIDAPTSADGDALQQSLEALLERARASTSNRELLDGL